MNKLKTLIITLGLSLAMIFTAFAGQWQMDSIGWWYQNDDGSYPVNCWQWIDGKNYYFDSDGHCLMNTITPDGYTVDGTGAWTVNGIVQQQESTGNNTVSETQAQVQETKSQVQETQAAAQTKVESTVYWTPNGKKYHSTQNCSTLKRSKTILSGTINQSGRTPCKVCH